MAKAVATRSIDLESIDRLEEKIKLLVGVVERLRANEGRLSDENARLVRELDAALARLTARKARAPRSRRSSRSARSSSPASRTCWRRSKPSIFSSGTPVGVRPRKGWFADGTDQPHRTVDIHGQRYPIRSSLDAAYVAELAAYVDEKMRLALKECPSGDTLKVAVLAALNIADEYFRAGDDVAGPSGWPGSPRP